MYIPDKRIAEKILNRLGEVFAVSNELEVRIVLESLTNDWLQAHPGKDVDIAQYNVIMDIADRVGDYELAKLMHLYRVGYFINDTVNYKPQIGEEYEIVNSNYLYAIGKLNCIGSRAA